MPRAVPSHAFNLQRRIDNKNETQQPVFHQYRMHPSVALCFVKLLEECGGIYVYY